MPSTQTSWPAENVVDAHEAQPPKMPAQRTQQAAWKVAKAASCMMVALLVLSTDDLLGGPDNSAAEDSGRRLREDFHLTWEHKQAEEGSEERVGRSIGNAMSRLQQALATGGGSEWSLRDIELRLEKAALEAVLPLQGDKKPKEAIHRAAEALTEQGLFLSTYGKSEEAVDALRQATELAQGLPPASRWTKTMATEDLSLLARTQAGLGRALCYGGGRKGARFAEAQTVFKQAVQTAREAAEQGTSALVRQHDINVLTAGVHLDFADCAYLQADIPATRMHLDAAVAVANSVPVSPRLLQRVAKVRAVVFHEEFATEAALRYYSEYFDSVISTESSALPNPDETAEFFGMMQNIIMKMDADGHVQEALGLLGDLERLQELADKEIHAKNEHTSLAPLGYLDVSLWSASARTKQTRSRMLQKESVDKPQKQQEQLTHLARKEIQQAVMMLRSLGSKRDLVDALNTLGNLELELNDQQRAEAALLEALQNAEEEFSSESLYVASPCHNLAVVVESLGRRSEALKNYRRAAEGEETVLGISHPDTAASLDAVASLLEEQGPEYFDEALEAADKAAKAARAAYPKKDNTDRLLAEARLVRLQKHMPPPRQAIV
eukprot:gnl/TRDRNA2_/TRDRNA2_178811_c0_seq1.p1 gnl/TRDRNA2_/TRDRNA2_178811_c0~~gnl/TRDRNA2_/TRDRNA2_178811_c0_seq1.p1  ORF type:complete len:609 (+),score=156.08 gnl/TRDRNA2_/TRDRNA2_178811_c0_seq1:58-1884(+)